MTVVVKVRVIRQSCFAMGLRESARHLSGKKVCFLGGVRRKRIGANKLPCQFAGNGWVV